jgi:hypothetical protein
MELKERLIEAFKGMDDNELVNIWDEFCYAANRYDDEIMTYEQLEEWANNSNDDTISILNRFYFGSDYMSKDGSANPNRNFFKFNGYGNIVSFDYIYNSYTEEFSYIDAEELAEYIVENMEAFYNDEIQEILDEYEENEEE